MLEQAQIDIIHRLSATNGWPMRRIAKLLRVSRATVHYWVTQRGIGAKRATKQAPKKSCAVAISRRRAHVKRLALKTDAAGERLYSSARLIAAVLARDYNIEVSHDTVRRDLNAVGLCCRVRPVITALEKDHAARLAFALANIRLSGTQVAFSDEKIFDTNNHSFRMQWVKVGERPSGRLVSRWPTGRVHVWGVISPKFRLLVILNEGEKLTTEAYIRKCVSRAVPLLKQHNLHFLQDGAACHRGAEDYLKRKNVLRLTEYPARSPDMNVIETLWAFLQRLVWSKRPVTRDDLVAAIKRSWDEITDEYVENLHKTWTKRLQNVIDRKGSM